MTLWTVGYGAWTADRRAEGMIEALREAGVTRLVDVRLNPCASNLDPKSNYGPKPWNLQAEGQGGIAALLHTEGITYEWIVELGNPQRQDPGMAILRAHLADPQSPWPVHRGLERLAERVRTPGEVVAVLCACARASRCHRTVIAHALADRHFRGELRVRDLSEAGDS